MTAAESKDQASRTWSVLPLAARAYIACVSVLGSVAIAWAVPHLTEHDAALFSTFAILALITSFAKINLPVARSASTLTVCYVIDFTTLLLLGRSAATITAAAGAWSQSTFRSRQRPHTYQMWFSISAVALTVQAAGLLYAWLGGHAGVPRSLHQTEALLASTTAFFLTNSLLVAGAVGLSTGQPAHQVWTANFLRIWPRHLLGFGVAVLAAEGIGRSGLWLLPFALALLALSYGNFKAYVARVTESVTDPLTEMANLRYLMTHVAPELARSEREGAPLALMLFDLDQFKSINDTHGHRAGDLALRQVAQCLQQAVRSYDICARYGGDEFVAVLPGCSLEDAERKARALQRAVAAQRCEPKAGVTVPLQISVGTAVFPADGRTFEQLLAVADSRMFEDKRDPSRRLSGADRKAAAGRSAAPGARLSERELREQLAHAQKLASIGQLAGAVAHDFNNVLTAIMGYSELITEQIGPDKPVGRDLMEITRAAQHAAMLTHQLLAFSRKEELSIGAVDLNEIVGTTEAMLRRLLGRSIAITTRLLPELHPVMVNATQLEQVLINLSVNARDAMPRGGMLTIETRHVDLDAATAEEHHGVPPGAYVVLTVSDTGVGMTPAVRAKIFDAFYTTKAPGRGTGLGLAMVGGIIADMGGHIVVDSTPGLGTTFRIYLPKADQSAERRSVAPPVTVSSPVGDETVLLVDDESGVRRFTGTVLRRHGYRVLDAEDAESALQLLEQQDEPIDLLLTDLALPGMDGRELAAHVRQTVPGLPVLIATGDRSHLRRADGTFDPREPILDKPYTARLLLTRTREVLDQHVAGETATLARESARSSIG